MTKNSSSRPDNATSSILRDQPTRPMPSLRRQQLPRCTRGSTFFSSAAVAVILASSIRSEALVASPVGLLRPSTAAAEAKAAAARGGSRSRYVTRRLISAHTNPSATASAFAGVRSLPMSMPRRFRCRGRLSVMWGMSADDHGAESEGEDGVVEGIVVEEVVDVEEPSQGGHDTSPTVGSISSSSRSSSNKRPAKKRLEGEALRNELICRERIEEEKVLAVNTQFYRARAYKEIDDLKEVWDDSELSECIRNAGSVLRGYNDIIEEYKTEFVLAKKQEKPGMRPFKVRDLKVQTSGTLAWVTCIEDMRSPLKPYPKTVQLVTNVFRKSSKGWRLTRHHASDKDTSGNRGSTQSSSSSNSGNNISSLLGDSNNLMSQFVDENGQVTQVSARMFRLSDGEIRPVDISELTGRDNGNDMDESAIISGELRISDDDDDDDDDDDEDDDEEGENGNGSSGPLPQWLRKMIQDKVKAMDKKDLKEIIRKRQSGGISGISVGGIRAEPLKEGVHWEFRDGLPVMFDGPFSGGADKQRLGSDRREGESGKKRGKRKGDEGNNEDSEIGEEGQRSRSRSSFVMRSEESLGKKLTRETAEAVKKLALAEKINYREKQLLLAHVIRTASWHSLSNIEMAFDVLVHDEEGRELDVVECEEFIDQCKAYAAELTEEQNRLRRRWWKFWARD